jgi:hypothetical protein
MTKPTAMFFVLLLLFFTAIPYGREWLGRRLGLAVLRLGLGFLAVCLAVVCWDLVIRVDRVNFLSASAARYGGLKVVPLERLLPRPRGWL